MKPKRAARNGSTPIAPLDMLKAKCAASGLRQTAREFGLSAAYICDVTKGRRPVGPRVLEGLGLMKQTVYRRR